MYQRHNSNQGHYFETESPATEGEVIRALKQAGIEASEYRAVLPKMGSMMFTEFGISDIWELCTGLTKCDGSCRNREKRHCRGTS